MAGYNTNAITNITNESKYYVYPMAASLKGGAVASEYNIRNLMTCLFNKSAARAMDDFILYFSDKVNGAYTALETYHPNSNWFTINDEKTVCTLNNIAVGPGEGNCNGYFTKLYEHVQLNSANLDISYLLDKTAYRRAAEYDYLNDISELFAADQTTKLWPTATDSSIASKVAYLHSDECVYFKLDPNITNNKFYTLTGASDYTPVSNEFIDKNEALYIVTTLEQEFNILLGLNWTINHLVSSAQVTICDNTAAIYTETTLDSDNDRKVSNYTEFQLLTKTLQEQGLLDAGILLGTVKVKKVPSYQLTDGIGTWVYKYDCVYTGNRYKTACIDLEKLGSSISNIGDDLYNKLSRLYNLMIDSGSFKIGTVLTNSGFSLDPQSIHHKFDDGISPYRLELGITPSEKDITEEVHGYLRIINYDENSGSSDDLATRTGTEVTDRGYLLKFLLEVDRSTCKATGLKLLELFNGSISINENTITVKQSLNVNGDHIAAPIYFMGYNTENAFYDLAVGVEDESGIYIIPNVNTNSEVPNTLTLGANTITTSKDEDGNIIYNINKGDIKIDISGSVEVADNLSANKLVSLDDTNVHKNLYVYGNVYANGEIDTDTNIHANGNITASGNITGTKVYGAVWM